MRYIDFNRVKELVSYRDVLNLLGWRHRRVEAGWYRGPCPVHHWTRVSQDCFAVCAKGWKCFRCGRHGDQLRLWAEATGQELLPAVWDLVNRLGIEVESRGGGHNASGNAGGTATTP